MNTKIDTVAARYEDLIHAWGNGRLVELTPSERARIGVHFDSRDGVHGIATSARVRQMLRGLTLRGRDVSWASDFGLQP